MDINETNIGVIIAYIDDFKNYIEQTKDKVLDENLNAYIDNILNKHVETLEDVNNIYNTTINMIPEKFKKEFSSLCDEFKNIFVGYCNLTYDFMMIVGKYFENNQDLLI